MRQGGPNNNGRRPRSRHHGGGGGGGHHHGGGHGGGGNGNGGGNPNMGNNNRPRSAASLRHQTFDSNCIDVRVRGNAWQVHEKYQALARDAQSSGDRVSAEHYLQHAEHYYRIIEAINEATAAEQVARGQVPGQPQQPGQFGQQPEMPGNYYGADGNQQPPMGNVAQMPQQQPQQSQQAEVQQRNQPQQQQQQQQQQEPSPFFGNEEMEDQGGPQPLVANR